MLICDECEKAFHTYCHKPKVKRIPEGDWFCKVRFINPYKNDQKVKLYISWSGVFEDPCLIGGIKL